MESIILTTPEQIREIVAGAVADAMKGTTRPTPQKEQTDALTFEEAHEFLRENGYRITESTLRLYSAQKVVPFKKIGKMAVYSRRDLLKWIESRTTRHTQTTNKEDAVLRIAQSASKKM